MSRHRIKSPYAVSKPQRIFFLLTRNGAQQVTYLDRLKANVENMMFITVQLNQTHVSTNVNILSK